jgi:tetratricopeptide (TPR) repeat protein
MSVFLRPAIVALGLSTVVTGTAAAQAKACEVDEGRPSQLGRATLAIQVASSSQDPAAAAKQLSSAVKLATDNGEKMSNQVGRNFVLGKALVLWSTQPNIELVTKRGPLGYSTSPEATIDLVAAIDSAFKIVETANPECISETSRWRSQRAWVGLVNTAIERLSADDLDAAEAAANNAIKLNPYGPYGYVIMAGVKAKRNQGTEAFKLYRQSIDLAAKDTIYDDIRRQSLIYLGNLAADSAEMADAAVRKQYVDEAKAAFEKVIADPNAEELRVNARAGMCRVAIVSGDTAALRHNYKDPLANPTGFEYAELMNAGVCMARAEMTPEATALFKAAYDKNPYHRDALSNLAIMHLRSDNHDAAAPLAARLVQVEPNNPDNMQLAVLAYAGIAKRSRDTRLASAKAPAAKAGTKGKAPATKAPAGPRLTAAQTDSLFEHEKAYTDSAVAMNDRKEKLELKVSLSDFTTNDDRAIVSGGIANSGSADKNVTLKVDFLDTAGKVVVSKEQAVSVPAGKTGRFSIEQKPGKGIAAFRYTRLD